jgi:hypothetical protein
MRLAGLMGLGGHQIGVGERTAVSTASKIRREIQRTIKRAGEKGPDGKPRWTNIPLKKAIAIAHGLETRDTSVPAEIKPGDGGERARLKNEGKIRQPGAAKRDHKAERAERKRRWKELGSR